MAPLAGGRGGGIPIHFPSPTLPVFTTTSTFAISTITNNIRIKTDYYREEQNSEDDNDIY